MDREKLYTKIEDKLEENICDLLKKENMTPTEVDVLGKAVDILKDISTIEAMDWYEDEMGEYPSASGARRGRRSGASRIHYNGSVSGERGRSPRTGRFVSRDSYPEWDTSGRMTPRHGEFYGHSGAMEHGRSGHTINDRMVDCMEGMYDTANSEHDRKMIDEVINFIRRMDG